jgi:hypothetical protein
MGELQLDIVEKLVRQKVTGGHKKQVDTVKNWFPASKQGAVETELRNLMRDPAAPVEGYGGARDNVRLSGIDEAKEWLADNGRDLWWV